MYGRRRSSGEEKAHHPTLPIHYLLHFTLGLSKSTISLVPTTIIPPTIINIAHTVSTCSQPVLPYQQYQTQNRIQNQIQNQIPYTPLTPPPLRASIQEIDCMDPKRSSSRLVLRFYCIKVGTAVSKEGRKDRRTIREDPI